MFFLKILFQGKTSNCGPCISHLKAPMEKRQVILRLFVAKGFSGKSKFVEEVFFFCFKMNTLLFCVFTFRVDYEMYSLSIWKFLFEECRFFKINTTSWVLHSKMSDVFNGCALLISTMICFAFFWWQEWQVLDGVAVLGHFQHCSVMRLSCLDELLNNDILLSLSFAWYV